jgi:hypothetical protein
LPCTLERVELRPELMQIWANDPRRFFRCLQFSLEVFGKFGVGSIRFHPRRLSVFQISLVWLAWGLGFLYYVLLIYTVAGTVPKIFS